MSREKDASGVKNYIPPDPVEVDLGLKLVNFHVKLRHHLKRKKKLSREEFGRIFGYTGRMIETYEVASVPMPAKLLYIIFKAGFSIDELFIGNATVRSSLQNPWELIEGIADIPVPAKLLYVIFKMGFSIDELFIGNLTVRGGDNVKDDNRSKLSLTDIKTSDIDSDLREEQQLLDLIGKMRRDRPTETARKIFEEKVALEIKKDYETEARVIGALNKPVESRGEGPSGKGVASHSKAGGSKRHRRR